MLDFQNIAEETESKALNLQPWPGYYRLRAKEMESLFSMYRPRSTEKALDIGSGIGFNAFLLNKIYDRTFAIDIYEEDPKTHSLGIEKTKHFLEAVSCEGVGVIPGECEHLPFSDDYFDTVYMFYTLEHIKNRTTALKEVLRVLKPEGEAVIVVPCFLERFLYPLSFYRDFFKKAALCLKKKMSKENKGPYPFTGVSGGKESFRERFFSAYPHFPFPEPHGEYADYFRELGASASFAWSGLAKRNNFKIKDMFTTMLIPKEFSSLFLGERALDFYIRTIRINRKLGKSAFFKHLGQNLCLVLERSNV